MTETTCYHCSQPIDGQSINDAGATYHAICYATAARNESCMECGGSTPDAFVATKRGLAPIHGACAVIRARRLAA